MSVVAGWTSIILVLFAMAISIVPGAASAMGLLISMLAMVVSLFSIKKKGKKYFSATVSLVLAGTFLVNDALRIWDPLPMPLNIKIGMYGTLLFVLAVCSFAACKLGSGQGESNKSVNPDSSTSGRLP